MIDYIGTDEAIKYYIGDTRVFKLYKGTTLIWESDVVSGVVTTYDVTDTFNPTILTNTVSAFTMMSVDGGSPISAQTDYLFEEEGLHTVVWDLVEPVIPDNAFFDLPVVSCDIADGIVKIGNYAFQYCPLTAVTLPNSLTKIGGSCFANTQIKSITIPPKVDELYYTWCGCSALTSVTFTTPSVNREYISMGNTFQDCIGLSALTFPSDVYLFGDGIFLNCYNIKSMVMPLNAYIGSYNFQNCTGLTSVTFGNSETSQVGFDNFNNCASLTAVTIPGAGEYSQLIINNAKGLQEVQFGMTMNQNIPDFNIAYGSDKIGVGCTALTSIHVLQTGHLTYNYGYDPVPSDLFSTDLPANGRVYFYYKSATETNINSKKVADAIAANIGRGWTSVSGGIYQ